MTTETTLASGDQRESQHIRERDDSPSVEYSQTSLLLDVKASGKRWGLLAPVSCDWGRTRVRYGLWKELRPQ